MEWSLSNWMFRVWFLLISTHNFHNYSALFSFVLFSLASVPSTSQFPPKNPSQDIFLSSVSIRSRYHVLSRAAQRSSRALLSKLFSPFAFLGLRATFMEYEMNSQKVDVARARFGWRIYEHGKLRNKSQFPFLSTRIFFFLKKSAWIIMELFEWKYDTSPGAFRCAGGKSEVIESGRNFPQQLR